MKKLVDPDKLCMGCMNEIEDPEKPCPFCGFLRSAYIQHENSLPLYEILNGKYLVGRAIGRGGFGITYIGWDFYQGKKICIKEYFPGKIASRNIKDHLSESSTSSQYSLSVFTSTGGKKERKVYENGLDLYVKEAENLSKFFFLPGIVSVKDFFKGNNTAYIIMEYIEGRNLKQLVRYNNGHLDQDFLFPVLQDVIRSLGEIHKAGIIHMDISPDNIMVIDEGNNSYKAKLIDFGAAKRSHAEQESIVMLKHGYAPIEQYARDGDHGPWTDIYSLCATIYYCLTGLKVQKAYERISEDNVVPIGDYIPELSSRRADAIMKGLSVQIEDRFGSVEELYDELYT